MFNKAVELIDAANSEDPNLVHLETIDGTEIPKELLYSQRMTEMLNRFQPDADDVAKLAVRAQHIQRWKSPRSDYPMNRKGYHQWRSKLYKFHADTTATLLEKAGYDKAIINRVTTAIAKKTLRSNSDTQTVEDIAALVFIEHYMLGFYQKHSQYDETRWIDIILKTWKKMSPRAHAFSLSGNLVLPESLVILIKKAVVKN